MLRAIGYIGSFTLCSLIGFYLIDIVLQVDHPDVFTWMKWTIALAMVGAGAWYGKIKYAKPQNR